MKLFVDESTACRLHPQFAALLQSCDCESLNDAWRKCCRADLMFWLIGQTQITAPLSDERKSITAAAMECAKLGISICEQRLGKQRDYEPANVIFEWSQGNASASEAYQASQQIETLDPRFEHCDFVFPSFAYVAYTKNPSIAAIKAVRATASTGFAGWHYAHEQCANIVRKYFPIPAELK